MRAPGDDVIDAPLFLIIERFSPVAIMPAALSFGPSNTRLHPTPLGRLAPARGFPRCGRIIISARRG